MVIGFVLGGTQALSRSLFSQLIPVGKEAEYFGFYEISDRGTSWLGPFAVRAHLPADRLLPVRDLQPGLLLRRRRRPAGRAAHAPGRSSRPATPHRSACDRGGHRRPAVPLPGRPPCRPRGPSPAPGAGAPAVLPRADGLRKVDAGAAGRPQPEPPGPARAAAHPGRPVGRAADQLPGRALPRAAVEIDAGTDLRLLVRDRWAAGHRVDYLIVDEAQFLTGGQVDQLAELVDESHVDVYAFGLTTDFRARLFPGTQRLLEVADDVQRVQVEVLCWCGLPGLLNARVVDGVDGPRRARRSWWPTPRRPDLPRRRRRPLPRRPLPGALPAALRPRRAGPDAGRPGAARALLTLAGRSPVRGVPGARI